MPNTLAEVRTIARRFLVTGLLRLIGNEWGNWHIGTIVENGEYTYIKVHIPGGYHGAYGREGRHTTYAWEIRIGIKEETDTEVR